jgi:hypothetical protein
MSDLVLGVDCSTTASKVLVWDRHGKVLAEGRASLREIRPRPLYSEQAAEGWWDATAEALANLMKSITSDRIAPRGGRRSKLSRFTVDTYVRNVNLFLSWCRREGEISDVMCATSQASKTGTGSAQPFASFGAQSIALTGGEHQQREADGNRRAVVQTGTTPVAELPHIGPPGDMPTGGELPLAGVRGLGARADRLTPADRVCLYCTWPDCASVLAGCASVLASEVSVSAALIRSSTTRHTLSSSECSFQTPQMVPINTGGRSSTPIPALTAVSTHSWGPSLRLS